MFELKSAFCLFVCLFLLLYVGNMKGKQWNGKHPPKKNREGKEKKEWEEEWSRVYSLQCQCPYYPFCLDHFSAYYCLLVILLVSFFFLYSTKCLFTPNICPFLFLIRYFFLGGGLTGDEFQGCLLIHTCMHPIWLKSWRRSMLLELIKA